MKTNVNLCRHIKSFSNHPTIPSSQYGDEGLEDSEGEFEALESDMSGLMANTNRKKKMVDSGSESDSDSD